MVIKSFQSTDDSILFLEAELSTDTPLLDLHGFSRRDAESETERFLNEQFLQNNAVIKIIHGKGSGILQECVERHLIAHPLVDMSQRASIGPDQGSAIYIKLALSFV